MGDKILIPIKYEVAENKRRVERKCVMAGRMKLEISESERVEYLEKSMKEARSPSQKERLL